MMTGSTWPVEVETPIASQASAYCRETLELAMPWKTLQVWPFSRSTELRSPHRRLLICRSNSSGRMVLCNQGLSLGVAKRI